MITNVNEKIKLFANYGITNLDVNDTRTNQYVTCPQSSCKNRNKSYLTTLSVSIEKGTWNCHHCGWNGSIFSNLKTEMPNFEKSLGTTYDIEDSKEFLDYFASRGISKSTLWECNVKWKNKKWLYKNEFGETLEEVHPTIVFINMLNDKIVNAKYRRLDIKRFMQIKDGAKLFYNLQSVADTDTCYIVEGEIDVLSMHECGFTNVISVPEGAPNADSVNYTSKFDFIQNSQPYLKHIKKYIIFVDKDKNGLKLKEELIRRLDIDKCYYVEAPDDLKDANDVLTKYGKEGLKFLIDTKVKPIHLPTVYQTLDIKDVVYNVYENGYPEAEKINIGEFDDYVKFRQKVRYIWTGIPAHGKTSVMQYVTIKLMLRNWKALMYSPENLREANVIKFAEQITGKSFFTKPGLDKDEYMTRDELYEAMEWMNDKVYFMRGARQNMTIEEILHNAKIYAEKFGINMLIIDPFNTVETKKQYRNPQDYVRTVLDEVHYIAEDYNISVHIVVHPTKLPQEDSKSKNAGQLRVPTLYDCYESSHWRNKAEVGIVVYRRKSPEGLGILNSTDTTEIYVDKIRDKTLGQEGVFNLLFNKQNERFYYGSKNLQQINENFIHALQNKRVF